MNESKAPDARGEMPQYELTEDAYLNDRYLKAGEVIYWRAIPEFYMKPMNAAAVAMKAKHPSTYRDPISALSIVGSDLANAPATDLEHQAETIKAELARRRRAAGA